MSLPDWLIEKLANPPQAGAGVHAWLFSCARQLHAHMSGDAIEAVLTTAVAKCERRVPRREIRDAVDNSNAVAWQRKDFSGGLTSPVQPSNPNTSRAMGGHSRAQVLAAENSRWPNVNDATRRCMIAASAADGVAGLHDLWERSPQRLDDAHDWGADDWLAWLFPGAQWLCLAEDHPATARSRPPARWTFGPAELCGLVVPSPMMGPGGIGLDGKRTHRCLDNTGPRRWLVIEFDSGSIDQQAALHWHLRACSLAMKWPQLRLSVHSAGKSLHGWYGPCESDERQARELMEYAAILGADAPAGWNRCQLMRLPGGSRKVASVEPTSWPEGWEVPGERRKLEVFYFDPMEAAA